jgi:DNA-binding winged helix-turn-helix (wHTH) protein
MSISNSIYEFGPFRLDPVRRVLLRDEERIPLSGKAFDMLVALIENSGRTFSKDELKRKIWSGDRVADNTFSVTLRAARKALGESAQDHTYILTSPEGYRFVAMVREVLEPDATLPGQENESKDASPVESKEKNEPERQEQKTEIYQFKLPAAFGTRWWSLKRLVFAASVLMIGFIALIIYSWNPGHSAMQPSITINPDGSWTVIVLPVVEGTRLETNGHKFELSEGDTIEVSVTGKVNIGRGLVGPDGEANYENPTMDSSFKDHVGGLEMWIGSRELADHYFIGSGFAGKVNASGIPTFRVIESLHGYQDGNTGAFQVTVKKTNHNQAGDSPP